MGDFGENITKINRHVSSGFPEKKDLQVFKMKRLAFSKLLVHFSGFISVVPKASDENIGVIEEANTNFITAENLKTVIMTTKKGDVHICFLKIN